MPERATVTNRSEKSAEAVVGDGSRPRAEREGQPYEVSLGAAMHQKPGQPGRARVRDGEADPEAASDEAALARHAQTGWGAEDLLGQALARENMVRAWKRVKANKGSAGVDGRTVLDTGEYLKFAWADIRQRLLDGSYKPEPVRRAITERPRASARCSRRTISRRPPGFASWRGSMATPMCGVSSTWRRRMPGRSLPQ